MVFYDSSRETSVSQEFCGGGRTPASAKCRSNATASLTKLNPNANPFTPTPIEWEKLPLRPPDSSLSPLFDLDFNERSFRSPIDEVTSFDSSDVLFMQPYPINFPLLKRSMSCPEYDPRAQQQISGLDRHIDSAIVDSLMIHNFPDLREKMNYTETKCYHCGCVGHMAVECDTKKQGYDAVHFQCLGTNHKAAKCQKIPEKEESGMVETESPVMYNSDYLYQNMTLKGSPAQLGKIDIRDKTWNRNSNLGQRRALENGRLFDQVLALK